MAADGFSLIDLPWLTQPPADFRAQLKSVESHPTDDWLQILQRLTTHALTLNQCISLSRALRSLHRARPAPAKTVFKLGIVGNATTDFILPALEVALLRRGILLEVVAADFSQAMQEALNPESGVNLFKPDAVLLALDHRGLPFRAAEGGQWPPFDSDAAIRYVSDIRDAFRRNCGALSIVQTLPSPSELLFGSLDATLSRSLRAAIAKFNLSVANDVSQRGDLLLDVDWLAQSVGLGHWYDERNWHIARLPFSQKALPIYGEFLARLVGAVRGKTRKCLVLDLDNTIWGGVIGDDGLEGIALSQGDPRGEAHRAVQDAASDLRRRGIVLAVCSKNEDAIARSAFRVHPGMILKEEDIAVFVANWNDKASNLEYIARRLEFGLDALVLLDDNPAERALVRQALPDVAVPEVGNDPSTFVKALLWAGYFESVGLTAEDLVRAEQYKGNADRAQLLEESRDLESFLHSLSMVIRTAPFDTTGRRRIAQLINKTNQFNVTTRRYTEADLARLESSDSHFTLQVSVSDRFGDNGMVGVVICESAGEAWRIDSWLMSCRVLNRRIEEAVCNRVASAALASGAKRLIGEYLPTARNRIVADLFPRLGFRLNATSESGETWFLDLSTFHPFSVPAAFDP